MTAPTIVTEDLGGSSLSRAARAGLLPQWYRQRPASRADWTAYLGHVAKTPSTPGWLQLLAPAFAARGTAADRLERVSAEGGVVVSSGQQPGLFGGPLMTLVKALTALALADVIEREMSIPAAPVFWAATDDADFDEAAEVTVAVRGGVRTLRLSERPRAGTPMSLAAVGDTNPLLEQLVAACGSMVDPGPLDAVRSAYREGATVGSAYVMLLRSLLEPLGIGVLDASHGAVRRTAAPLLFRALECSEEIGHALAERADAIRAAGFAPQVEEVSGLSLVFVNEDGIKRRLRISEREHARSMPPEQLSPNVLLRPLVERSILPSAAYVGGPGEIAYFAQVSAVAQAMSVPAPLILPRWSVTIIEPQVSRLLQRLGLRPADLAEASVAEGHLARAALPSDVSRVLRTIRRTLADELAELRAGDAGRLVPTASIDGTAAAIEHRIARLERRFVAAVKRRESDLMSDVATVRGALYPDGVRQERRLSFIPLLTRGGRPLLDDLVTRGHAYAAALVAPGASSVTTATISGR